MRAGVAAPHRVHAEQTVELPPPLMGHPHAVLDPRMAHYGGHYGVPSQKIFPAPAAPKKIFLSAPSAPADGPLWGGGGH